MLDFSWFSGGTGLACGTRQTSSILRYRNNIFLLGENYKVSPYCDFPHDHNIYWRPRDRAIRGWAILGANADLGPGDQIADPKFINGKEGDFHLHSESPAIGAGVPLGYTDDMEGRTLPAGAPDVGAYQRE